ncbi:MAG: hypothetical protein K6A30_09735 [Lachnospiraceae bacterium]|nr:hypothetical protein [Lachnospiraceae bacterium]
METLIELYDDRAIENVIGPETFHPSKIIYLCPTEVAQNKNKLKVMRDFFDYRGFDGQIDFIESSFYKTNKIYNQLLKIEQENPDCVLDVTGGTDAALIAAGMFCNETGVPTLTYSRRKNKFYDINNAEFAEGMPCTLKYKVEDFFRMAGGELRKGRVDNKKLHSYMDTFEDFFRIFLKHKKTWASDITFFQRISQGGKGEKVALNVKGSCIQKSETGSEVRANLELFRDLEEIGYLTNVAVEEENVSFTFKDHQIRSWLRDVGSVLELYMYAMCEKANIFEDVVSSAVVDWDVAVKQAGVSNEIDVVATRGVVPLFISCKACDVKTRALNELAILADRFGGKGAKAVIATTEHCNAVARHRAAQLQIAVIDIEDFENDNILERLKVIMKVEEKIETTN